MSPPMPIVLRAPSAHPSDSSQSVSAPPISTLLGTWTVTHSSLPMWRTARNVRITYTALPGGPSGASPRLDDVVTYQGLRSDRVKTVRGIDTPVALDEQGADANANSEAGSLAYNWRGRALLFFATSKWEILGYGVEAGSGNPWAVTYFAKTIFTPAGVDFYSRSGKLEEGTVEGIREALKGLGGEVAKIAEGAIEVKVDTE